MNVALVRDPAIVERIAEFFAARGRTMPENNGRQADVPVGATVIPQTMGTAPGLICPVGHKVVYAVPGRALRDGRDVRPGRPPRPPAPHGRGGRGGGHLQPGGAHLGDERVRPGRGRWPPRIAALDAAGARHAPSPSWPAGSRGSRCASPPRRPTPTRPTPCSTPRRRGARPRAVGDVVFGVDDDHHGGGGGRPAGRPGPHLAGWPSR